MYTPGALDEIWTGCPVITFQAFADLTGMNTIQRPHHEAITHLKLHFNFEKKTPVIKRAILLNFKYLVIRNEIFEKCLVKP